MPTPREHLDRLVKTKALLKADAATLNQLRVAREARTKGFADSLQAFTDYMRSKKLPNAGGLKAQLARKDRDPRLDLALKVAKSEIDAYAKFCSGEAGEGLRRVKGDAKAFRKALQELVQDTQKREKARAPDVDTYRQLLIVWTKAEEEFKDHIEDALDIPDKIAFDKGRALKKLETDFSPNFREYGVDDEF